MHGIKHGIGKYETHLAHVCSALKLLTFRLVYHSISCCMKLKLQPFLYALIPTGIRESFFFWHTYHSVSFLQRGVVLESSLSYFWCLVSTHIKTSKKPLPEPSCCSTLLLTSSWPLEVLVRTAWTNSAPLEIIDIYHICRVNI